ncbi:MAG: nucleotide exchange factor GrpE [Firmicutes bacterium]|nr:nucleotide exchange factor GrpE [Bacillota bacterium]
MEENNKKEIKGKKKVKDIKPKKKNKFEEENLVLNEKILRLNAEIQNMRKRNEDYISNILKYDGESLIVKLLDVVDNFERAILLDDHNLTDELSKFLSGFKMIYADLLNILNNNEVKEIECLNNDFDPNIMEAVLTSKVEGLESGKVIEVLQKGYLYKDKLIRAAMVKVSE